MFFDPGNPIYPCKFCKALLWSQESSHLCCKNGKLSKTNIFAGSQQFSRSLIQDISDTYDRNYLYDLNIKYAFSRTNYNKRKFPGPNVGDLIAHGQTFTRRMYAGNLFKTELAPGILNTIAELEENLSLLLPNQSQDNPRSILIDTVEYIQESGHPVKQNNGNFSDIHGISYFEKDHQIYDIDPLYENLGYPVIHFNKFNGWDPKSDAGESFLDSIIPRLFEREFDNSILHKSGKLFQHWLVDQFSRYERMKIQYIKKLNKINDYAKTVNEPNGYLDANEAGDEDDGTKLYSSFLGGPRYMYRVYRDSVHLTHVEKAASCLFITITMNIRDEVLARTIGPTKTCLDAPVLAVRLFRLRIEDFINAIRVEKIFGNIKYDLGVLETQFRGYLHVHWLVGLENPVKLKDLDELISARLPKKDDDNLRDLVIKYMVHGPCQGGTFGSHCSPSSFSKCSKGFPAIYQEESSFVEKGYPNYKRIDPNNGGESIRLFI
jgi:hypothetical protein